MTIRDEARQEAERRWTRDIDVNNPLSGPERRSRRVGFELGALWASEQADRGCGHPNHGAEAHDCAPFLPDREPSEESVEKAAIAIGRQESCVNPQTGTWYADVRKVTRDRFRGYARAALLAAQEVRRADAS